MHHLTRRARILLTLTACALTTAISAGPADAKTDPCREATFRQFCFFPSPFFDQLHQPNPVRHRFAETHITLGKAQKLAKIGVGDWMLMNSPGHGVARTVLNGSSWQSWGFDMSVAALGIKADRGVWRGFRVLVGNGAHLTRLQRLVGVQVIPQ